MPGYTLTNKAMADLKEIARYTQNQWGREQRDTYLTMLDACFHQLSVNPLKGKDCSDIRGLSIILCKWFWFPVFNSLAFCLQKEWKSDSWQLSSL